MICSPETYLFLKKSGNLDVFLLNCAGWCFSSSERSCIHGRKAEARHIHAASCCGSGCCCACCSSCGRRSSCTKGRSCASFSERGLLKVIVIQTCSDYCDSAVICNGIIIHGTKDNVCFLSCQFLYIACCIVGIHKGNITGNIDDNVSSTLDGCLETAVNDTAC